MRTSGPVPRRRAAWLATFAGGVLWLAAALSPGTARADARDDLKAAYNKALGQYNNLELDPAQQELDRALSGAAADDPSTAPLRMLRAVIIFSNTGDKNKTTAAFVEAVKADYNIALPSDMRSPDLQKLLDKARKDSGVSAPSEALRHTTPSAGSCGQDLTFEALTSGVPDSGQVALYWRTQGDKGEFKTVTMDAFGNLATATITSADHGDKPVEYFIYVFDAGNKPQANKGDQENPIVADVKCVKEQPKPKEPEKPPPPKNTLPRVFINLGVGTGFGVARGVADQTYQQFSPSTYGVKEASCALARWADPELPTNQADYMASMGNVVSSFGSPYTLEQLAAAYQPDACAARHKVTSGMALAPFHIAPEIGGRIAKNLYLSGFARLQVVTGSKVFRDDPNASLMNSYANDVSSPNPEGTRTKPGFTAAGGLKLKYFLGSDERKFRLFVGGFVGGGFSRLRVPMGFANDRNGNSVPDDREQASSPVGGCTPIWPYKVDCANPTSVESAAEIAKAASVKGNADDGRVDTVRIGGGMVGALFGFHYQVVKNFALFGELNLGVWFPRTTSFLIDLNIGPAITF